MKNDLRYFYLSLWIVCSMFCRSVWAVEEIIDPKHEVRSQYEPILELINQHMPNNLGAYKNDLGLLGGFIDQNVRVHWDASSTTSALIGKEVYQALSVDQEKALVAVVDRTLLRYAVEGFTFYNGQTFNLIDIAISSSGNMGWLKVLMESPIIPDLNLEVLIKRNKLGIWKAVDVRFKGITYVAIKKHLYRRLINKKGVDGLIDNLKIKNDKFFSKICGSKPKEDARSC